MIFIMVVESEQDKSKLEILFEHYGRLMYKIALDILHNHMDVEDVLQDSYEKVAKNIAQIGDPYGKEARNYLAVITKNTALDLYRKKMRKWNKEINVNEIQPKHMPRVYILTEEQEEAQIVVEAILELPDMYREVLSLKYANQCSVKEISKILKISETNVKQRIFRAKNMLKEEMQKRIK